MSMPACEEKCRFTLIHPERGQLFCTETCDLDKPGVDDLVSPQDYDEAKPGTSIHGSTHICQVHNDLRKKRHFGFKMNKEMMALMQPER